MVIHKHHILPIRLGGNDDESNLIQLTIEEHAEAHRVLYEKFGDRRDYVAWKCLSGMMGKEEMLKELYAIGGRITGYAGKGKPKSGRSAVGHKKSRSTREKISKNKNITDKHITRNQSGEKHWTNGKVIDTTKNINKLISCKICGKTTTAGNIGRWHKHDGSTCLSKRDEKGRFI